MVGYEVPITGTLNAAGVPVAAELSVNTSLEFSEDITCSEVCVTLTDVMAGLDREVTVSVEVMDGTASGEGE